MQVEQKNSINSIGNRSWIWSRERCLGNSACFPRSAQVLKTCSIAFVLLPGVMNVLTHTRTHTTHTLAYTRKCLDTLMLLSVALDNGSLCLCLCLCLCSARLACYLWHLRYESEYRYATSTAASAARPTHCLSVCLLVCGVAKGAGQGEPAR